MNPAPAVSAQATAARPAQAVRRMHWSQAWDRVSLYLPVLLMGLLALASYWVLRYAPAPAPDAPVTARASGPDYVMRDFAVRTYFPDGRLKSEIVGREARHFPGRGELEIDQARVRSIDLQGRLTTAEAERVLTDDTQDHYLLEGQVLLVRTPAAGETGTRLSFQGEQLQMDTVAGSIRSELPVTVRRGADVLRADRLHYQDQQRSADLSGRVQATLVPRP